MIILFKRIPEISARRVEDALHVIRAVAHVKKKKKKNDKW